MDASSARSHGRLLLASGSEEKLVELRQLLAGLPLAVMSPADLHDPLPAVDETGATFAANAALKALAAAAACASRGESVRWALADDSGLVVDALQGAPGVQSARFAGGSGPGRDAANTALLLRLLRHVPQQQRQARFVCHLALAEVGQVVLAVEESVEGVILEAPQGEQGFGYDPVFYHQPSARSLAEMSCNEKNAVSHRGLALRRLRRELLARVAPFRHAPG